MLPLLLTVGLVVTQDPGPASPAPQPAAAGAATTPDPTQSPAALKRPADDLSRAAARLKDLSGPELEKAAEDLRKKLSASVANPVLPPRDFSLDEYFLLPEPDQALVVARSFFDALVTGDAGRVVEFAGLPFMLEDKRFDRADELRTEWARHLRSKRTDLVSLYGVEVFTPADLEKKYGPPPARLRGWPWRQSQQYLAVANVSGRSAVVLLRLVGSTWQIVAYHD